MKIAWDEGCVSAQCKKHTSQTLLVYYVMEDETAQWINKLAPKADDQRLISGTNMGDRD